MSPQKTSFFGRYVTRLRRAIKDANTEINLKFEDILKEWIRLIIPNEKEIIDYEILFIKDFFLSLHGFKKIKSWESLIYTKLT
jgi:hypothetical protein